ncbi:unnamed protein product, partial [Brachionus calyciflorus]
ESIVITTTSFIVNQSEVLTISGISDDKKTLTFLTPLKYEHLAYFEVFNDSKTYKINAGVGLLSRNVKVIGAEYSNQQTDLYGFRIIVSDYSVLGEDGPLYYKGYARLSNVEFVHPGQFSRLDGEEYKYGILYSNLGTYNYSRPSYVNNCAFRNGFSAAIGILGSASIPLTNNVIYHTIDYGIYLEGHSNIVRNNLIVFNRWLPSFWFWELINELPNYMGAIDIHAADSAVVENNFIAGSERVGLLFKGDVCIGDEFTKNQNHSIKNNTIYSTISAVTILPSQRFILDCVRISNFTVFKSNYWGIYYQNPETVRVESNILIDNQINIFTQVITPNILDHSMSNKKTFIQNNLIVGQSPNFNCTTDIKSDDLYYANAGSVESYTSGPNDLSKVGVTWAQFLSGSNNAPLKPWTNIMTYNALDGLMIVDNNTFAHFGTQCNGEKDFVFSTNKKNDDGHHPIVIQNSKLFDVDLNSKIWIHRPNIGKINPSDCVDMDCDGFKKNLLTDQDGTFLGSPGTVISQSEFEWGSQQRGIGDFRIPKDALLAVNGSMLPISSLYSNLGIVREEDKCSYKSAWQAYECNDINHKMLLIESMDPDTESRRLSPVAIISDNKYLDLINGPQDHGWCFGYTCQKRVSSFMAIVAGSRSYDIFLSSSPPKQLRFRLINSDPNFKIRISMCYFSSNRIDVYKNDSFVLPTNGYYEEGKMKFNVTTNNLDLFMPTVLSKSGTNLVVRDHRKVYATLTGSDYLDFKMAAVVVLKFGVSSITPEAFFEEKTLVKNFADLLGIDASRIRQVNIIRERRRRRQISSTKYFELVIFDNPSNQSTFNSQDQISANNLNDISANISSLFSTGQLQQLASSVLNINLSSLNVEKPLANSSSEIRKLDQIKVIREASGCREQSPCQVQPIIVLLDDNNQTVTGLESLTNAWTIKATLLSSTNPNAEIIFEKEVSLQNDGFFQFKNLGISEITETFNIQYELVPPTGMTFSKISSANQTNKQCSAAVLDMIPLDENKIVDEEKLFNLTFQMVDKYTQKLIKNISWRNHQWKASARLYSMSYNQTTGVLRSASNLSQVDTITSSIKLLDLSISTRGMYIIEIFINSTDNEYFLKSTSKAILVKQSTRTVVLNEMEDPVLFLTFNKDITSDSSKTEIYKATIYNNFILKYNLTLKRPIYLYSTSTPITSSGVGSRQIVNSVKTEYLASLGFNTDQSLSDLKSGLESGFVLDQGISLNKATLNNAILNVKSLEGSTIETNTVTTSTNTGTNTIQGSSSPLITITSSSEKLTVTNTGTTFQGSSSNIISFSSATVTNTKTTIPSTNSALITISSSSEKTTFTNIGTTIASSPISTITSSSATVTNTGTTFPSSRSILSSFSSTTITNIGTTIPSSISTLITISSTSTTFTNTETTNSRSTISSFSSEKDVSTNTGTANPVSSSTLSYFTSKKETVTNPEATIPVSSSTISLFSTKKETFTYTGTNIPKSSISSSSSTEKAPVTNTNTSTNISGRYSTLSSSSIISETTMRSTFLGSSDSNSTKNATITVYQKTTLVSNITFGTSTPNSNVTISQSLKIKSDILNLMFLMISDDLDAFDSNDENIFQNFVSSPNSSESSQTIIESSSSFSIISSLQPTPSTSSSSVASSDIALSSESISDIRNHT